MTAFKHGVGVWLLLSRGMQSAWGRMVLGDVIMAVGGQRVACVEDLISAIERFSVGDQVPLTVRRDGRSLDVQVPLLGEQAAAKPF
jgi:S1-C subfamily serine protease